VATRRAVKEKPSEFERREEKRRTQREI